MVPFDAATDKSAAAFGEGDYSSMEGAPDSRGGIFTFLTCGSVDDGKSTLIGRLLWDLGSVTDDQRANLERSRRAAGGGIDYSLLVDGLIAEREQGITIDIAWRYLDTPDKAGRPGRRIIIIDSPGHEQYTRNMASGASHADCAVLLVDARHGVKTQTRRHAAIAALVGVRHLILAVNKMDLVDWSEDRFRAIEADFREVQERFAFASATAVPVAAVSGDNVTSRSKNTPWYWGRTLLESLEQLPSRTDMPGAPFRLPVQMVIREGVDFRGLAGTVVSGAVKVGDTVVEVADGRQAKVARILTPRGEAQRAGTGEAVVVELDRDLDIARGSVLADPRNRPTAARRVEARLVWLSDQPFDAKTGYLLRTSTDLVSLSSMTIATEIDLATLEERPAKAAATNAIIRADLIPSRPVALDTFAAVAALGGIALIDAVSGQTVAAGIATEASAKAPAAGDGAFVLTRALLRDGLAADLGARLDAVDAAAEAELRRRANEVALLLNAAGVRVSVAL
jgi:bifunctional enzyme CysN/CysC